VVDIVKPAGRTGRTLYASGVVPPPPVTGVKAVAAWFWVRMVVGTAWVAVTAELTVRVKVLLAVALLASVMVTVKVERACTTEGVPVIWPVVVDMVNPVGRAGATAQARGVEPPVAVTGVTGVIKWLRVKATAGTAWFAVSPAFTVRSNEAVAVAPLASVTVTV
jgi:hypothetical protein